MDELTISTSTAIRNNSIIFGQNSDTAGIRRDTYMIDMNRTALYYIAAALWGTPGVIITIKGVKAYLTMPGRKLWWLMLITAAVLAGFFFMFRRAADKYSAHIAAQARKTAPWRAFPLSGWILIIFMLCLGISLKFIPGIPAEFIASFYSGLGPMLLFAACRFISNSRKANEKGRC